MITRKQRHTVQPSSNDAISSWLDVLTSMLSLPETKRTQIRDELEDHLRSRVDDLLISGIDEHEAIQQAVSELGETAQLAKVVTNAHTHTTLRRRTMQTLLIAGALAGMSFGGFTLLTTAPAANLPGAFAGVLVSENSENTAPETRQLAIEEMPTLMAFDELARAFGYSIDIHTLDQEMVSDLQHRHVTISGEYTLEQAAQSLRMQTLQYASVLTGETHGDVLELLTRDEQARRSVITRVFRLGGQADEHAIHEAKDTLGDLLEASVDTEWVSANVVGNGLVVSGPPAVLEKAEQSWALIRELHEEASRIERALEEKEAVERSRALAELKAEYTRVQKAMLATEDHLQMLQMRELELGFWSQRSGHIDRSGQEDGMTQDEFNKQDLELSKAKRVLELDLKESKVRHAFLRETLIETEYAMLFENLQ